MTPAQIRVDPHTSDGKHTDIAMTSLYNAIVSIVNSERTLVWQRYQSLLLANSVVFGLMGGSSSSDLRSIITGLFGLGLCYFWWILTSDGWRFFDLYSRTARRFRWPRIDDAVNPIEEMYLEFEAQKQTERSVYAIGRFCAGDSIKAAALGVVLSFALGYLLVMGLATARSVQNNVY